MSEHNAARADSPKAVIDTSVLLLGMFTRGSFLPLIHAWSRGEFVAITSAELLDELAEVAARPKFQKRISRSKADKLLELIYRKATIVTVASEISIGRDPDDYPVLRTAVSGKATHLVTADNDLLEDAELKSKMKQLGVAIVSAGEFLRVLKTRRGKLS